MQVQDQGASEFSCLLRTAFSRGAEHCIHIWQKVGGQVNPQGMAPSNLITSFKATYFNTTTVAIKFKHLNFKVNTVKPKPCGNMAVTALSQILKPLHIKCS